MKMILCLIHSLDSSLEILEEFQLSLLSVSSQVSSSRVKKFHRTALKTNTITDILLGDHTINRLRIEYFR